MVKRLLFVVFCCCVLNLHSLLACDVCGTSAGNMGMGLMTDYRSNYIRMSYFGAGFESHLNHSEYDSNRLVSDKFQQINLSCRYAVKDKLYLMAWLPLGKNTRNIESGGDNPLTETTTEQGVSDAQLTINYVLLNNLSLLGDKANLYLEIGTGLVAPIGQFDEDILDRNLPENFNIGKGSWGGLFQVSTVCNFQKFGFVFSNSYRLNNKTKSGYKFGNQFNSQITAFRELDLKQIKFVPNAGLGFESISKDKHANDRTAFGTGGQGFFLSASFVFNTDTWVAGMGYSIPTTGQFSDGEVNAKARLNCQVSFLF